MKKASLLLMCAALASVALEQACTSGDSVRNEGTVVGASGAGPDQGPNTSTGGNTGQIGSMVIDLDMGAGMAKAGSSMCGASMCMERVPACGDGYLDPNEKCDDGNGASGDGCGANCDAVEKDFACPTPGMPCVSTVACGDAKITGSETCDDGNATAGDGCSAQCQLEVAWACPVVGARCGAALCGDSMVAGLEECDDGNANPGDGCSATCTLEPKFKCPTPGQACSATTCGDGIVEGTEQCDDMNFDTGDGCSPFCRSEPVCTNGVCQAKCGDGLKLDSEACDDGNTRDFDGCSSTCTIEQGFTCEVAVESPVLPVVYRDFVGTQKNTPVDTGPKHPDFQNFGVVTNHNCQHEVQLTLDAMKKPALDGNKTNNCVQSAASFAQWYRSDNNINRTVVDTMALTPVTNTPGAFEYVNDFFFPLEGRGFNDPNALLEHPRDAFQVGKRNFSFTTELRYWFTYRGGEKLTFYGDDDLWVFINGRLAVSIPGLHYSEGRWIQLGPPGVGGTDWVIANDPPTTGVFDPAVLGLTVGGVYEVAIFNAERQTGTSTFKLTLQNFLNGRSVCHATCGDGIVASSEACDKGTNDGSYNGCNADCTLGPRCGDGTLQAASGEVCDNGVNLSSYAPLTDTAACAPECKKPNFCGDGVVDSLFGEACDDGVNAGSYGKCAAGCRLGEWCGDGKVNGPEQCDDGNKTTGDGCTPGCVTDLR
ncbi:MAG: DUF4215 domain-containing protein [Polyangiaceae bacterium]|nr:DUF4215 domain-containing protein [Polyangiaceae bacterium]